MPRASVCTGRRFLVFRYLPLILASVLIQLRCHKENPLPGSAQLIIDVPAGGGTVHVPSLTGGSAVLDVPAGRAVQITAQASAPEAVGSSSVYSFAPDGTTFDPPATLTISLGPKDYVSLPQAYVAVRQRGGEWHALSSRVDVTKRTVSARVSHFTEFAVLSESPSVIGNGVVFRTPETTVTTSEVVTAGMLSMRGFTSFVVNDGPAAVDYVVSGLETSEAVAYVYVDTYEGGAQTPRVEPTGDVRFTVVRPPPYSVIVQARHGTEVIASDEACIGKLGGSPTANGCRLTSSTTSNIEISLFAPPGYTLSCDPGVRVGRPPAHPSPLPGGPAGVMLSGVGAAVENCTISEFSVGVFSGPFNVGGRAASVHVIGAGVGIQAISPQFTLAGTANDPSTVALDFGTTAFWGYSQLGFQQQISISDADLNGTVDLADSTQSVINRSQFDSLSVQTHDFSDGIFGLSISNNRSDRIRSIAIAQDPLNRAHTDVHIDDNTLRNASVNVGNCSGCSSSGNNYAQSKLAMPSLLGASNVSRNTFDGGDFCLAIGAPEDAFPTVSSNTFAGCNVAAVLLMRGHFVGNRVVGNSTGLFFSGSTPGVDAPFIGRNDLHGNGTNVFDFTPGLRLMDSTGVGNYWGHDCPSSSTRPLFIPGVDASTTALDPNPWGVPLTQPSHGLDPQEYLRAGPNGCQLLDTDGDGYRPVDGDCDDTTTDCQPGPLCADNDHDGQFACRDCDVNGDGNSACLPVSCPNAQPKWFVFTP